MQGFTKLAVLLIVLAPVTGLPQTALPLPVRNALAFRSVPDDALSAYVEEIGTGDVILAWNETLPRNPASVEKMVTTLVALDTLGPTYRWRTEVRLSGEVSNGVLHGDLMIKGYGDPYLVTERFWQLLREVRQLGVVKIDGDLLLDDSYFDVGDYDPAAFDHEPLRAYNVAPNALLTNFKVVRYFFRPDPGKARVDIRLDPSLDNLEIINQLRIGAGACRGYQRGITITPNDNYDRMVLSGRFPSGCETYAMDRTALSHNEFTYGLFKSLWRELGGEFSGGWKNKVADPNIEPDVVFDSPPLAEVIGKVNKYSNSSNALLSPSDMPLIFTVNCGLT